MTQILVLTNADHVHAARAEYEKGLVPLTLIDHRQTEGNVLVVLKDPKARTEATSYHCHRYFQMGSEWEWECSVDGQGVSLEAVFSWLCDPGAASTREFVKPNVAAR